MSKRVGDHIRANVYGIVAIFIALGGTAIASQALPANSVVSKTIKNGQVKGGDLAANSVSGPKVKDGTLTGADLVSSSVTGQQIDELSLDPAVVQLRIGGSCAAGSSISAISSDGTVHCETDDAGFSYQAGDGLNLTGGDTLRIRQDCSAGQILKFTGGSWTCAADAETSDTAAQILAKVLTVDGPGSTLDADTIDGIDSAALKPKCASGYVLVNGLCWESTDQSGFTFYTGANRCRAAGGRLPTFAEFVALAQSGVSLNSSILLDWTSDTSSVGNAIFINAVSGTSMDGERAESTSSFVRCVANPEPGIGFGP